MSYLSLSLGDGWAKKGQAVKSSLVWSYLI